MQEKEVVDVEIVDQKGQKKDNAIQKFWKKTKKNLNESLMDIKIENIYKKNHDEFVIYKKDALLSQTVYGEMNNLVLVIYGKHNLDLYSVVLDKNKTPYYIYKLEEIKICINFDNQAYIKDGMKIYLKNDLEEVDVIKAGNKYYLYKGNFNKK